MKFPLETFCCSSYFLIATGLLSLSAMLLIQVFGVQSVAHASERDEFPGRRQGGGTHWIVPGPVASN